MKTQTKIAAAITLTAILSAAVFTGLSYFQAHDMVSQAAHAELEDLRDAKAAAIEEFFDKKIRAVDMLSRDVLVATALTDLQAAYRNINQGGETVLADVSSNVRDYYERRALPPIAKSLGVPNAPYDTYGPKSRAARHLQNVFNVNPQTTKVPRSKSYEALHGLYDAKLKSLAAINGFADIFLIDMAEGDVIYSAQKGIDFGTNVNSGAFADSGLGQMATKARHNSALQVSDISLYAPARSEASVFIAAPIYDQNIPIGILALRFKAEQVSALSAFGLKERGDRDVYIAGSDYLMRSNAPFAQSNLNAYVRLFKDAGGSDEIANKIKRGRSTILAQNIETAAVTEALSGESGTLLTQNYLGASVISAYAPLTIGENDWVILAERNAKSVAAPFSHFAARLGIAAAILAPFLMLLALWFATRLMRPARIMMDTARAISSGESLTFQEDKSEWGRIGFELNKAADLDLWQAPTIEHKIKPRNPIKLIPIIASDDSEAAANAEVEDVEVFDTEPDDTQATEIEAVETKNGDERPETADAEFENPESPAVSDMLSFSEESPLEIDPLSFALPPTQSPLEITSRGTDSIPETLEPPLKRQQEEMTPDAGVETMSESVDLPQDIEPSIDETPVYVSRKFDQPTKLVLQPKPKRRKRAAYSDTRIKNAKSSTRVIAPRAKRKVLPPMNLHVKAKELPDAAASANDVPKTNAALQEPLVLTQIVEVEAPAPSVSLTTMAAKTDSKAEILPEVIPPVDKPRQLRRRRR